MFQTKFYISKTSKITDSNSVPDRYVINTTIVLYNTLREEKVQYVTSTS